MNHAGVSLVLCAAAIGMSGAAFAAPAIAATVSFHIPAGDMARALDVFSQQSGMNIVYATNDVRGKRTTGVRGVLPPGAALDRLLAGSDLAARRSGSSIVVMRDPAATPRNKDASASLPAWEEAPIVVTATRRENTIESVPFNIQAFSRSDLETTAAKSASDIARLIPGLTFTDEGRRDGFRPFLRGLRSGEDVGLVATTAVYLDDVPIDRPGTFRPLDMRLLDLERIEILRGPQGTHYGAGAMGGVIRYISVKPDLIAANAEASAALSSTSHGGSNQDASAIANLPIVSSKLALRLSAAFQNTSGVLDNVRLDSANVDDARTMTARLALRWAPDDLTIIDASYQNEDSTFGERNWFESTLGTFKIGYNVPGYQDESTSVAAITVQRDVGIADLTSTISYLEVSRAQRQDITHSERDNYYARVVGSRIPLPPFIAVSEGKDTARAWTQEIRLVSKDGGPFDWSVGAYLYHSRFKSDYQISVPIPFEGQSDLEELLGVSLNDDRESHMASEETLRQFAVFGEIGYRPIPEWHLSLGARHFDFRRRSDAAVINQWASGRRDDQGLALDVPLPEEISRGRYNEDGAAFRFNTSYALDTDSLIYVTIAESFRPGGFNAETTSSPLPAGYRQYLSDSIVSYEFGAKIGIGRHVYLTSSVYHIDWSDMQTQIQSPTLFGLRGNAGSATVRGCELQLQIDDIPARGTSVQFGLSHIDGRLDERMDGIGFKDEKLPFVPRFSGSLLVDHTTDISDTARIGATFSVSYTGASYSDFGPVRPMPEGPEDNPRYRKLDAYWLANLSTRLSIGATNWRLFVNNLLDTKGQTFKQFQASFSPYRSSFERTTLLRPRTVGVEVRHAF